MDANDQVRRSISATVDDIARIQREMGVVISQPDDREGHDIVARIQRKVMAADLPPTKDKAQ